MADQHEHETHHVNYFAIFIALCVFTALSVLFDMMQSKFGKQILASLVLGVAACKATFVMLYFMHLKFEGGWKYVILAPTTVLAMAIPFALAPDIGYHYYSVQVPQTMIAGESAEADGHGDGAHDAGHGDAGKGHGAHGHDDHGHDTKKANPAPAPAPAPAERPQASAE